MYVSPLGKLLMFMFHKSISELGTAQERVSVAVTDSLLQVYCLSMHSCPNCVLTRAGGGGALQAT